MPHYRVIDGAARLQPREGVAGTGAQGRRVAIVAARFNGDIVDAMVVGAQAAWLRQGGDTAALLLVRVPGRSGRRDDGAVSLADLPALTVALADGAEPLRPAEGARISMPSVVALRDQCDRVWRGLRTPTRKLVLNADGSPWLLFDLSEDPGEERNLAADPSWRGEVERLRALC